MALAIKGSKGSYRARERENKWIGRQLQTMHNTTFGESRKPNMENVVTKRKLEIVWELSKENTVRVENTFHVSLRMRDSKRRKIRMRKWNKKPKWQWNRKRPMIFDKWYIFESLNLNQIKLCILQTSILVLFEEFYLFKNESQDFSFYKTSAECISFIIFTLGTKWFTIIFWTHLFILNDNYWIPQSWVA